MLSNLRSITLSLLYAYFIGVVLFQYIIITVESDLINYTRNLDNLANDNDLLTGDLGSLAFYAILSAVSETMPAEISDSTSILALVAGFNAFLIAYCIFKPIGSLRRLIVLIPVLLCFLLSPKVMDLIVSNLRGGFSLAFFVFAMTLRSNISKYSVILISILIHQSAIFLLVWLLLYRAQQAIPLFTNSPKIKAGIVILLFAPILVTISSLVYQSYEWQNGALYTFMLFCLLFLFIVVDRRVVLTEEGFIAIATLFSLIVAFLIDYASIRLLSWALIFYLLFAVKHLSDRATQSLFVFYLPMFSVMLFYWLGNY